MWCLEGEGDHGWDQSLPLACFPMKEIPLLMPGHWAGKTQLGILMFLWASMHHSRSNLSYPNQWGQGGRGGGMIPLVPLLGKTHW